MHFNGPQTKFICDSLYKHPVGIYICKNIVRYQYWSQPQNIFCMKTLWDHIETVASKAASGCVQIITKLASLSEWENWDQTIHHILEFQHYVLLIFWYNIYYLPFSQWTIDIINTFTLCPIMSFVTCSLKCSCVVGRSIKLIHFIHYLSHIITRI